jgi:uncharacterized protein YndB with AHSA1/START domain
VNRIIAPAPVRKSVTVKAPPARAFEIFTADMTRWWRPEHHIGKAALKEVVVKPRVGGRWFERDVEGGECEWGKVLVWEPPGRAVFAWQLSAEWRYDANFVTELEVRFIPEGTGTRVELEHRYLERYGERAGEVRAALDSDDGWNASLRAFAEAADGLA